MHWLTQELGCIRTKAVLGYRVTLTRVSGRGKNICTEKQPSNYSETSQSCRSKTVKGKKLFFLRGVKSGSMVDYNERAI